MQEIRSSNPPVITGIRDPNKSRARHHRSLKLGSELKYLNKYYWTTQEVSSHWTVLTPDYLQASLLRRL